MVAPIVTQIGLPFLIDIVSRALGVVEHPVAKSASQSLKDLQGALAGGLISPEAMAEANRHAEEMAKIEADKYSAALESVNATARTEVASDDAYVRRMRPTFGYLMAITWAVQMLGLAYVVIFKTEMAHVVINAMASLSTIWGIGLSVLGVYIYKRSEDKKLYAPEILEQTDILPLPPRKPPIKPTYND